jgi:Coenzyme F420 hydrogenase/dehydrogenase, beta subunit C terminus
VTTSKQSLWYLVCLLASNNSTLSSKNNAGTNCVDNSPTPEAAQNFLKAGVQVPDLDDVRGYEFMQDFKVHVKTRNNGYITRPYFSLPGTIAGPSIATSCLACFDYTNGLADVVVGYMGAPLHESDNNNNSRMDESYQTLTVRNERGSRMVDAAINANRLHVGEIASGKGTHERLASITVAADSIVLGMVGDSIPEKGMPVWMGNIVAFVISNYFSPKGVNFARYSIDYHILRNYLHVLQEWGEQRANESMPQFARDIVAQYLSSPHDETMKKLKSKILQRRRR